MASEIREVYGACPHDCWDTCGLRVQTDGERVLAVRGDRAHPVTRGFLCVKVNHYLERLESPDRVLYPMRRIGRKGEGRFERIGWDEAVRTIAAQMTDAASRFGAESILPYSFAGTMGAVQEGSVARRFFARLGASRLDRTICTAAASAAITATYGGRIGPDPLDMVDCRLILVWGLDPMLTNVHQIPILDEARRRGCRIVTIDPLRTETADRYGEHLALRPGTDAALALALMHVLVRDDLLDHDWIAAHTEGFEALRARVQEYPPARAQEITGLAAERIEELAQAYGSTRPSCVRLGLGFQRHDGGAQATRAIACLPALTGAWRDAGGGLLWMVNAPLDMAAVTRPDLQLGQPRSVNMLELGRALTGDIDPPVKVLYVYNSNPAATAPDQRSVLEGLRREDLFTVVHEQLHTDTVDYADIVLPATMQMEHWDLHTSYWHLYVQLNQPAVRPPGECLPNSETFRRLAAAMRFDEPCFADDDITIIRQALSSPHPWLRGITFEELLAKGFMRLSLPQPFAPFANGGIPTSSGRVRFLAPELERFGVSALPDYVPPREGLAAQGMPGGRLQLLSPAARESIKSSFAHLASMERLLGQPALFMYPADMAERGITEGQLVLVANERGETVLTACASDRLQHGLCLSFAVRWNRRSAVGTNINQLTSQRLSDFGGGATFYSTMVDVTVHSTGSGLPSREEGNQ